MIDLQKVYSRDEFLVFLKSFIPDFQKDIKPVNIRGLSSIQKAHYLGESGNLDIQVFELLFEGSANKRVALTKDAFSIMRSSAIFRALAIFHSPDSDDWRLSLMTATPERTEKGKVSLAYSNPKRLSFFLGPNAKINTPTKFILKKDRVVSFEDLKSRFSIEVVNKEFYKEISAYFAQLVGGSLYKGKKKEDYEALLKLPFVQDKSQTSLGFAVRLIGRVIFCWFLREKKSDQGRSLMPNELLSLEAVKKNKDYYHKILEPIFFEVLNKPVKSRMDDYSGEPFSSIPYLNGGLFSPHYDDYYKNTNGDLQSQFHNTLVIPDEWLVKFFEVLETYNFTIDENTSFDEELSIDPEMLGRIFENLLAEINPETGESARKSTGSYYTPRVIVDYMVDESLLLYLKNQTQIDEEKLRIVISYDLNDDEETPLKDDEKEQIINALEKVKILDPACGSGAFPIGALQKIVFILQQADPEGQLWFKKQIKNTSPEIKKVIEREFAHKNFDYIRKLGIIRENIYGVDIQPIATEISRLRCFLTLVVDERIQEEMENRGIEPLPNLDFKFVTANTLMGLPGSQVASQIGLFEDDAGIKELKELRDMFFNASGSERDQLKLQFVQAQNRMFQRLINEGRRGLADLTTKLTAWDPFSHKSATWFDPEWMFGIKSGFDIVLANPPYIGERGHEDIFHDVYKSEFGGKYHSRWMDYFYYFFHLAINCGNNNSIVAFITTNYFLTSTGGGKLREDIMLRTSILHLINFNELKIFENALGQHNMISILMKTKDSRIIAKNCITHKIGVAKIEDLQEIIDWSDKATDYYNVKQDEIYEGFDHQIRLSGALNNNSQPDITNILSKTKSNSIPMGMIAQITMGIVTLSDILSQRHLDRFPEIEGKKGDGIYILTNKELQNLNLNDSEKEKFIKPFYKNSDIKHYYSKNKNDLWLVYIKDEGYHIELGLSLTNHFKKYKNLIVALKENFFKNKIAASIVKKWFANNNYFVLFTPKKEEYFTAPKIIAPYRSKENYFAYNESPWFGSKDIAYILSKDHRYLLKYLLAILNSKLILRWLYFKGKRKGDTLELYQKPLSDIPIKKISTNEQKPFIEVVDKILTITKDQDYLQNFTKQAQVKEYQKKIDDLVYQLYDLTPEEIAIVEEKK